MQFKLPFDPRDRYFANFDSEIMTEQHHKASCDVNNILAKYRKTGLLEHANQYQGQYGDFTSVEDYHTSINAVMRANAMFEALPSNIRTRFSNDPAEFLGFVQNDANRQEAIDLGLIPKSVVSESSVSEES